MLGACVADLLEAGARRHAGYGRGPGRLTMCIAFLLCMPQPDREPGVSFPWLPPTRQQPGTGVASAQRTDAPAGFQHPAPALWPDVAKTASLPLAPWEIR